MTLLTAPAEIFPQALPLMTEVWQSWSISQGEMNRRTAQAMLTMQETNQRMERSQQEINSRFERFPGRYRVVPSDHLK